MGNRLTLINQLAGVALDARFINITVKSCNALTGEHLADQGALSVVFKADDLATGKPVAIKFFDPEYNDFDGSRKVLFQRESSLLAKIKNNPRCLKLIQDISQYSLTITDNSGKSLSLHTYYIVTEWIEADILDYFLNQDQIDAVEKLKVFRQVALSVFVLHSERIYHRDIKRDNFRIVTRENTPLIVAIDLGSASLMDSPPNNNQSIYQTTRGAPAFSALEAMCGLGGIRKLGICGDIYALGALLHDLFNVDLFCIRLTKNTGFANIYGVCSMAIINALQRNLSEDDLLKEWHKLMSRNQYQLIPVDLEGVGNRIPSAIKNNLNQLYNDLVNLDYRKRIIKSDLILRRIDATIRVLTSSAFEEKRNQERFKIRTLRELKARQQQEKLNKYLKTNQGN